MPEQVSIIREAIAASGKSNRDLAAALGVTPWTVRHRLDHDYRWTIAELAELELILGRPLVVPIYAAAVEAAA